MQWVVPSMRNEPPITKAAYWIFAGGWKGHAHKSINHIPKQLVRIWKERTREVLSYMWSPQILYSMNNCSTRTKTKYTNGRNQRPNESFLWIAITEEHKIKISDYSYSLWTKETSCKPQYEYPSFMCLCVNFPNRKCTVHWLVYVIKRSGCVRRILSFASGVAMWS